MGGCNYVMIRIGMYLFVYITRILVLRTKRIIISYRYSIIPVIDYVSGVVVPLLLFLHPPLLNNIMERLIKCSLTVSTGSGLSITFNYKSGRNLRLLKKVNYSWE